MTCKILLRIPIEFPVIHIILSIVMILQDQIIYFLYGANANRFEQIFNFIKCSFRQHTRVIQQMRGYIKLSQFCLETIISSSFCVSLL